MSFTPPGTSDPQSGVGASIPGAVPSVPQRRGTVAWALGFLAYFPVPFLNVLVVGVVQLIVGLGQRKHCGLAAVNGVRAANWGLTQLCWPVLMAITMLIAALTGVPGESGGMQFHPVMEVAVFTVLGLYVVLGLLQLVYAVIGTVQASKGRAVRLPVIPFLRAPRS